MDDAGLAGEVLGAIQPLVMQARRRAIGRGRQNAGASGAADDFDGEMVDRHGDRPDTPLRARRHDV